MIIDSGFLARLGQSLQTSRPDSNDAQMLIQPLVNLELPLGSPLKFVPAGSVVTDSGCVELLSLITNGGAANQVFMSLTVGVWRIRINMVSVCDFSNLAASNKVLAQATGGAVASFALLNHPQFINQVVNSEWVDTIYCAPPGLDFFITNGGSGVGQNSLVHATMTAQRLL